MHTLQQPHEGAGIRGRLTSWRVALTLGCLLVAGFALLWAVPGGLFRSAAASSQNSTTPQTKPIEQIVPGDLVLARDPETGQTRAKKVLRVFRNLSDHLRLLTVRNADGTTQVLRTTDGHPFWVPDRGWTAAAELKIGDNLVQADGQPATLVATAYEAHPEGVPIFNFEVEGFHTYFVAAHGTRAPPVLVHNTSPNPAPTTATPGTRPPAVRPGGRAPEFPGGRVTESGFLRSAEQWLGPGYREVSPGRYVSADGMRQVRFGAHETRGPRLHGHFEAYDRPYGQGGRVIENTVVDIIPD